MSTLKYKKYSCTTNYAFRIPFIPPKNGNRKVYHFHSGSLDFYWMSDIKIIRDEARSEFRKKIDLNFNPIFNSKKVLIHKTVLVKFM
jgi:hypothetical protein